MASTIREIMEDNLDSTSFSVVRDELRELELGEVSSDEAWRNILNELGRVEVRDDADQIQDVIHRGCELIAQSMLAAGLLSQPGDRGAEDAMGEAQSVVQRMAAALGMYE